MPRVQSPLSLTTMAKHQLANRAAHAALDTNQPQEKNTMSTNPASSENKPPKQIHIVKMYQDYFDEYKSKRRNAQTRVNDRHYQQADLLIVQEYSELLMTKTGREYIAMITSVSKPPGLLADVVLLHTKNLT